MSLALAYGTTFIIDNAIAASEEIESNSSEIRDSYWLTHRDESFTLTADENGNVNILTEEQFAQFAYLVNMGNSCKGLTINLMANLDLSAYYWSPIGCGLLDIKQILFAGYCYDFDFGTTTFQGTFDGNDHKISGLKTYMPKQSSYLSTTNSTKYYSGLFGHAMDATIYSVILEGSDDYNIDKASNSLFSGVYIGGLLAYGYNVELRHVYVYRSFDIETNGGSSSTFVGGVAGYLEYDSRVLLCNSYNDITLSYAKSPHYANYFGGIVGSAFSSNITQCFNYGDILFYSTDSYSNVGGVAGRAAGNGAITYCGNLGDISTPYGVTYDVGGVAGYSSMTVENCVNYGDITGYQTSSKSMGTLGKNGYGGIVGISAGTINKCINYGNLDSSKAAVGGIVGLTTAGKVTNNACLSVYVSGYTDATYYRYGPIHGDVQTSNSTGSTNTSTTNQKADFENNYYFNNVFESMRWKDINGKQYSCELHGVYNSYLGSADTYKNEEYNLGFEVSSSVEYDGTYVKWVMTPLVCAYFGGTIYNLSYTMIPVVALGRAQYVAPEEDFRITATLTYSYGEDANVSSAYTSILDGDNYLYYLKGIFLSYYKFYLSIESGNSLIASLGGVEMIGNSSYTWTAANSLTYQHENKSIRKLNIGGCFYDTIGRETPLKFSVFYTGKTITQYYGMKSNITDDVDAATEDNHGNWMTEDEAMGNYITFKQVRSYDFNLGRWWPVDDIRYGETFYVSMNPKGGYKLVGIYYYDAQSLTETIDAGTLEDKVDFDNENDNVEALTAIPGSGDTDEDGSGGNTDTGDGSEGSTEETESVTSKYIQLTDLTTPDCYENTTDNLGIYATFDFLIKGIGTTTIYFVFDYITYTTNVGIYDVVDENNTYEFDYQSFTWNITTTIEDFNKNLGLYGYTTKVGVFFPGEDDSPVSGILSSNDSVFSQVFAQEIYSFLDNKTSPFYSLPSDGLVYGSVGDLPNYTKRYFDMAVVRQAINYTITIHNMAERYNYLNAYEEYSDGYGGTMKLAFYNGYGVSGDVLTPQYSGTSVSYLSKSMPYNLNGYLSDFGENLGANKDKNSGLIIKFDSKPGFALTKITSAKVGSTDAVEAIMYSLPTKSSDESATYDSSKVESKEDDSIKTYSSGCETYADGVYIFDIKSFIKEIIENGIIDDQATTFDLYAYFDIKAYYMQGQIDGLCNHGANKTCEEAGCFGTALANYAATFKSEVMAWDETNQTATVCLNDFEKKFGHKYNGSALYYPTYFAPIILEAHDFEDALTDNNYSYLSNKKFVGWYVVKLTNAKSTEETASSDGSGTVYKENGDRYLLSIDKKYVFVNEPQDLDGDGEIDDLFTDFKIIAQYVAFDTGTAPNSVSKTVSGVKYTTYYIENGEQLAWISYQVACGNNFENDVIMLKNNIDMSGVSLLPIGGTAKPFKGTFDGCGYVIENLKLCNGEYHSLSEMGLFGYVENATIKNVTLVGGTVTGYANVGAIAGKASNTLFSNVNNYSCEIKAEEINFCNIYGNEINKYIDSSKFTPSEGGGSSYVANDNATYNSSTKTYESEFSYKYTANQTDFAGVVGAATKGCEFVKVSNHATIIYSSDETFAFAIAGLTNAYSYSDDGGITFQHCSFNLCYTDCKIGTLLNGNMPSGGLTFARFVQGTFNAENCYYKIDDENLYLYNATLSSGENYSGDYSIDIKLDSSIWLDLYGLPVLRDFYWA